MHHTAGRNSLAWLTKNPQGVSTHVLVSKTGIVYRMVPDEYAAHTCGFSAIGRYTPAPGDAGNANQIALSVELENLGDNHDLYPPAQLSAAAYVVANWWNKWGDLPIVTHKLIDQQGKNDPAGLDLRDFIRRVWAWYEL